MRSLGAALPCELGGWTENNEDCWSWRGAPEDFRVWESQLRVGLGIKQRPDMISSLGLGGQ